MSKLAEIDYGGEVFEVEMRDWIGGDAAEAMQIYKTRVWACSNAANNLIGFASLGKTQWRWKGKKAEREPLAIIPAVGLGTAFRGLPEGADRAGRYSHQIIGFILGEAQRTGLPAVGLFVHPDNARAIRLYTDSFQFVRLTHVKSPNPQTRVDYPGYIRFLDSQEAG